ncbi:MAG TPA: hypothetical protein PK107_06420 [Candidatus Omnitrophota bacterium]|nr:hypothetical protein [Candidatus Omnitrophota bacterium]HQO38436.1 hypothetical protein [Candidatus Omnitrophota bacterium]
MRIFLILLTCCMLLSGGCGQSPKPALTIGSIRISAEEFEAAYQDGRFQTGREISREEFLDLYVNRKLFLKEAEELGLDKDPVFLQGLQLYWEQALMKSIIARKINESTLVIRVSDNEIADYFERHKDTDFAGKSLSEVSAQIKILLFQVKQKIELQNWMGNLRRNARIHYDHDQLGIKPETKEE